MLHDLSKVIINFEEMSLGNTMLTFGKLPSVSEASFVIAALEGKILFITCDNKIFVMVIWI